MIRENKSSAMMVSRLRSSPTMAPRRRLSPCGGKGEPSSTRIPTAASCLRPSPCGGRGEPFSARIPTMAPCLRPLAMASCRHLSPTIALRRRPSPCGGKRGASSPTSSSTTRRGCRPSPVGGGMMGALSCLRQDCSRLFRPPSMFAWTGQVNPSHHDDSLWFLQPPSAFAKQHRQQLTENGGGHLKEET